MSLEAQSRTKKTELHGGIHLVKITGMGRYLDSAKNTIIKDNQMGIVITFSNDKGEQHEQVYWIGGDKEKYFTQMCIDAMIDMSQTPLKKSAAIGKELYIAIREVYTLINGGTEVKKDIVGNDIVEYYIFKTFPYLASGTTPEVNENDLMSYRDESGAILDTISPQTTNSATLDNYIGKAHENDLKDSDEPNFD